MRSRACVCVCVCVCVPITSPRDVETAAWWADELDAMRVSTTTSPTQLHVVVGCRMVDIHGHVHLEISPLFVADYSERVIVLGCPASGCRRGNLVNTPCVQSSTHIRRGQRKQSYVCCAHRRTSNSRRQAVEHSILIVDCRSQKIDQRTPYTTHSIR